MPNDSFIFKKFKIAQKWSSMKVGTDGVLLGAWCRPTPPPKSILDIGTGTGLIALMQAQNTNAQIDAIEIDSNAYRQAVENFQESSWGERLAAHHISLQDFSGLTTKKYCLITCNPPYFTDSFKSPDTGRNTARHTESLTFFELTQHASILLKSAGTLAVIIPFDLKADFIQKALYNSLFLKKSCQIIPKTGKNPKRILMEFTKTEGIVFEESLTIELEKRHEYSTEYINLTKEFYLNF